MSKKRKKKIQDFDRIYWFARYCVDFVLKHSYRSIIYSGKENIPNDGAVIYAPNHTNALMDALVLLAIDRKPKVFVARADIFKNRRLAKIFTFLKIMPIMRLRDGFNEVKKNQETITKAVDVLKDKIPFCIFPEGTHQAKHSLLPLSKGIFRIAFQAQEMMPQMPLYIIPTGIRYGNHFRFRSTVHIQIGEPINVGEFIAKHTDCSPQEQMNLMKNLLAERLQSTILYIPNEHEYNAIYEICNVAHTCEVEEIHNKKNTQNRHHLDLQSEAYFQTLKRITALKENDPETANNLIHLANKAFRIRESKGISLESVSSQRTVLSRIVQNLILLITLPYTLFASLFAIPMVLICNFIFTKLKDAAFRNSVRYLSFLLLWPMLLILYSLIACCAIPMIYALPLIILLIPAPIVAHDLWYALRIIASDIKLHKAKKLNHIYAQIREIVMKSPFRCNM